VKLAEDIIKKRRDEKQLVKNIAKWFAESGYVVFTNVKLLDSEIDIVAIKECKDKYIVKVVEVKSLPKRKLIQQIHARTCIAHYVYAGLPAQYRDWAEKKLPDWCGIILVRSDGSIIVARRAQKINSNNDGPLHFARLLLTCGNFMSAKVYGPCVEGSRILVRLRSFLSSSFSSSDSSREGSSHGFSLYSIVIVPCLN